MNNFMNRGRATGAGCCAVVLFLAGCASSASTENANTADKWHVNVPAQRKDATSAPDLAQRGDDASASAASKIKEVSGGTEYFGTSAEAGQNDGTDKKGSPKETARRVELNFQDADVRGVVGSVVGDMLKLNYSIDSAVQGKITLRTGRPIWSDSVLPALEAALATVSAALIVEDGTVLVVPMDSVSQRAHRLEQIDPYVRQQPGFAVEVIPLRYVGAKEMQRVLESFSPKGSVLQADEIHNHLVIAGTSQDRSAIAQTIEKFDVDAMKGMSFALYKVEQATPDQVIAELHQVFQPPLELVNQRVRLVPIPRLQSILGISKYRADLELLDSW